LSLHLHDSVPEGCGASDSKRWHDSCIKKLDRIKAKSWKD